LLRIFICYGGREGESIGIKVRDFLRRQGMDAFLASPKSPDIPAGLDYQKFIEGKLFSSDLMVPICDSGIHESKPARREIGKAVQRRIPIVAFVRRNCRVPKEIKNKWVPVQFSPTYPESAFSSLLLEIYRRVDWEREQSEDLSLTQPTRLPVFAELENFFRKRR